MKTFLTAAFSAVLLFNLAPAAAAQSYTLQPESKVWVDGTSTRSDWTVTAAEVDAELALESGSSVPTLARIVVPSSKIESNESTIMDRLMHDALKVEEHPTITYELVEATPSDNDPTLLKTTGRLTLGGVTRELAMDVKGEVAEDGTARFTGSTPLKMTDYGLTPPTAMFGALRTGDDVTVSFDVVFARQ